MKPISLSICMLAILSLFYGCTSNQDGFWTHGRRPSQKEPEQTKPGKKREEKGLLSDTCRICIHRIYARKKSPMLGKVLERVKAFPSKDKAFRISGLGEFSMKDIKEFVKDAPELNRQLIYLCGRYKVPTAVFIGRTHGESFRIVGQNPAGLYLRFTPERDKDVSNKTSVLVEAFIAESETADQQQTVLSQRLDIPGNYAVTGTGTGQYMFFQTLTHDEPVFNTLILTIEPLK